MTYAGTPGKSIRMNYREDFRGASSSGDALDIYQNTIDEVVALQAATLGQLVARHATIIEDEGAPSPEYTGDALDRFAHAARTDATLEHTVFQVMGQLQPLAFKVTDIVAAASQTLTAHMSEGDRNLYRRGARLVDQGAGSPAFQEFINDARPDDRPALIAALDRPVTDQLHKQADYVVGGVDTRAFVTGREQLSPQGKPGIWASLDSAIFQQVQRHAEDFGAGSPVIEDTLSRATGPAQAAIRAALDKSVWGLMEQVHRQYSVQSVVLEAVARKASSLRIGQILHSRLTGRPLPPAIIELPGQTE